MRCLLRAEEELRLDRPAPGSLTVLGTFTLRSTEIQETKACRAEPLFGGCFWRPRGMAAREKRLEEDLEGRVSLSMMGAPSTCA